MNDRTLRVLEFHKIIARLAALTASQLGRELAEKLVPETDPEKVKRALKETSDGVSFIVRRGNPPLGGIHDIRGSIRRVRVGSVLSPGELLRISDVLRASRNLKNYAGEDSRERTDEESNIVRELINGLATNRRIEDRINSSILGEEEIADDASPTLASIRKQIRNLQESIKEKLNEFVRSPKYQKYMQEPIVTMRGDRYVVPVRQEYRNQVPGLVHDSSASGATIFVEPMVVVEANNNIKQLRIKEQLEIERILQELTSEVASILPELASNIDILARLDFIFAKARLSVDYNCVCPGISSRKKMVIKKGRHPLLDPETVVPIDFWIGDQFNVLVITGPNTGGKTVTLKTVGLFTLMMQSGLHVPASEGTQMYVFDKVFADIGDEQSIEQSLSTFSSHMTNIVKILKEADDRSLVLFDELGAGTDPTEGAALAMSILDKLREWGTVAVATTHYSELKAYAISTEGVENACCEFDVETLKPTYKLLIGVPGKSNAFAIAKRLGLQEEILDKAKEFLTKEEIQFEDILMTIEKNRRESENERIRAERIRIEIDRLKKELEDQKRKLDSQKDKIIRDARDQARKILLEAKEEADAILEELKRLRKEQEEAERSRAAEELRVKLRTKLNRMEESLAQSLMPRQGYVKPPDKLKPGDSVMILNLNQKGTVVTPPDKDGETVVQVGIMKINVHVTNLRLIDDQGEILERSGIGKISSSKSKTISPELDVRGMVLEQAIASVDKYIDDASLSGLREVVLIHGKGTGTLRNGIHQFLKTNKHIKSFRLGGYGEGDTGVTIVELK